MYYTNEFVDSLPSVSLEDRKLLPDSPGIYLAIAEDMTVLYVGQSTRVRTRWWQHHRFYELKEIGNVRIAWVTVSDPTLLLGIEKALISHFNPPLNGSPVLLREYISFLLEHPELGTGKEALEKMLAVYKASSLGESEDVG